MDSNYKFYSVDELVEKYKDFKNDGLDDEVICKLLQIESDNMKNSILNSIADSLSQLCRSKNLEIDSVESSSEAVIEDTKPDDGGYDMRKDIPKFDISSFTDKEDFKETEESKPQSGRLNPYTLLYDNEEEDEVWTSSISSDYIKPNRYKPGQFKVEIPYGSSMARFYVSGDDLKELPNGDFDISLNMNDTYRFYQGVGNNTGNPDVTGKYLKDVLTSVLK